MAGDEEYAPQTFDVIRKVLDATRSAGYSFQNGSRVAICFGVNGMHHIEIRVGEFDSDPDGAGGKPRPVKNFETDSRFFIPYGVIDTGVEVDARKSVELKVEAERHLGRALQGMNRYAEQAGLPYNAGHFDWIAEYGDRMRIEEIATNPQTIKDGEMDRFVAHKRVSS